MNATHDPSEHQNNSTRFGGEGLYESSSSEQDSSLRVQLGELLDESARDDIAGQELIRERMDRVIDDSLQSFDRSARSTLDFVRENPLPVLAAVGGIVAIFAALGRRRRW